MTKNMTAPIMPRRLIFAVSAKNPRHEGIPRPASAPRGSETKMALIEFFSGAKTAEIMHAAAPSKTQRNRGVLVLIFFRSKVAPMTADRISAPKYEEEISKRLLNDEPAKRSLIANQVRENQVTLLISRNRDGSTSRISVFHISFLT